MKMKLTAAAVLVAALGATAWGLAAAQGKAAVTPKDGLSWKEVVPGVSMAVVDGDPAKGPSHFYLKYKSGLVTPLHHHSADHYVTTLSGVLVLSAEGKEHRLPAGSYFALTGKAPHAAKVEGAEDAVMFIDARGAWDVVAEKSDRDGRRPSGRRPSMIESD
ncbi:MAG TPA: cupin domain-containing protein [Planctomycetota bacterium]